MGVHLEFRESAHGVLRGAEKDALPDPTTAVRLPDPQPAQSAAGVASGGGGQSGHWLLRSPNQRTPRTAPFSLGGGK